MAALTHPVVALGILSTALALGIAAVTWQQRETRGARTYTLVLVTLAVWSALYVGQLLSPTVPAKRPWFVARHAMSPLFPMAFWVFTARYADRRDLLARRYLPPIVGFGAGLVLCVLVNPGGLYWSSLALDRMGSLTLLELTLGPLFWLNCAYIFGVVGVAHVVIVARWRQTFASYRPQIAVMAVIGCIEFALAALFLSEHTALVPALNPWPNVQLITFGATVAAVPIGWSYVNDFLFDIQPLARQAVIESMDDAVFIVDREGIVRHTNPPANRLLGRRPDAEAPAGPVEDVFAVRPTLLDCYDALLAGDPLTDEATILDCTVDGEQRFYDIGTSTIRNSAGERAGAVVVARDVTETRRQRGQLEVQTAMLERKTAQLERQNERLDQFGQYVSHDLRNPLQVASGHLELARATGDLSRLDDIDDAIRRMGEMVEDLRELTTVDRDSLDQIRVNLATAAHTAWTHVDTTGGTLAVPENAIIRADEDYLLHVFENLFRNAMEHGGTDELTVAVGPLADGFYIEDDGVGIPEAERDDVLEHGYSTSDGGTGLGMSIVRTIADAHGWSVTVTESAAGGARFEFRGVDTPD